MITKGSIVVDELIIPIHDMYLDGGRMHFVGNLSGPLAAVKRAEFAVFDRSGGLVIRSNGESLSWPRLYLSDTLTVVASVSCVGKLAVRDAA